MAVATQNANFTSSRIPGTRELRSSKSEVRRAPGAPLPDLSRYPNVMTKRHVAEVLGKSVRWVELHLAAGTFPIPRLERMPTVAFSKARVQQFFEQETFRPLA